MAKLTIGSGVSHYVSAIDEITAQYINFIKDSDYNAVFKQDKTFTTFYHLSDMRHALLNWYDFGEDASLLEIGGGMGALTGLFCQRCARVVSIEKNLLRAKALHNRYQKQENLQVYAADALQLELKEQFDVIAMVGVLDAQPDAAAFLQAALRWLRPEGRLLIATENRLGINYLCGAPEPNTGLPFGGLREAATARPFSKAELTALLQGAGLEKQKFFYLSPDHVVAKSVFTDEYLPDKKAIIGSLPYANNPSSFVAAPTTLALDAVANGGFAFAANSFLVECTREGALSDVAYNVSSTDHSNRCKFATTTFGAGVVEKRPLHEDSVATIAGLGENLKQMAARNLNTVPFTITDGKMVMPRVQHPTLFAVLQTMMEKDDTDGVVALYDALYEAILQSSVEVPAEENQFPGKQPGLDYGPILATAYLEMVPLNCFYDGTEIIFYDQEMTEKNYPAKFVLFRAICHSPFSLYSPLEKLLTLRYGITDLWEQFLAREVALATERRDEKRVDVFGRWKEMPWGRMLQNEQALLHDEEGLAQAFTRRGFQTVVIYNFEAEGRRAYQLLAGKNISVAGVVAPKTPLLEEIYPDLPFFEQGQWPPMADVVVVTRPDEGANAEQVAEGLCANGVPFPVVTLPEMARAGEMPEQQKDAIAEEREGYPVTVEMKNLWRVELDILGQFMRICEKYGLRYYAMNGTLLGAVRHGGFIPWDDDIDVAMPRADLERFKELAPQELAYPYYLQTPEQEPYMLNAGTRLRNSETMHIWEPHEKWTSGNKGCFIDILPLDNTYTDPERQKRHNNEVLFYRKMLRETSPYVDYDRATLPAEVQREKNLFAPYRAPLELQKKIKEACLQVSDSEAEYWAILGRPSLDVFEKSAFDEIVWMDFEEYTIAAPAGYGKVITTLWEDVDVPPELTQTPKHAGIIDTQNSYKTSVYNRENNVFYGAKGQQILLFGAGPVLDTYLRNHGDLYPPAYVFDADPGKWGQAAGGLTVQDPANIPGLLTEGGRVIILDKNHKGVMRRLTFAGVPLQAIYTYTEGRLYK